MTHNQRFLISLSLLALLPLGASAQRHSDTDAEQKPRVVVVDDEACGCELYFIDGIQTTQRDGLFGFKREDGTEIVPPTYKYVDRFHGDYCIVYADETHCGLIDRNGRVVVPPLYQQVDYPSDGMIRVAQNELFGFFDTLGFPQIGCKYRTASGFSEGRAVVLIDFDSNNCAYGYIDKKDSLVLPAIYEYAFPFQEGCAVVQRYERFGMIDRDGREVLPIKYAGVGSMIHGNCFVMDVETERAAMFDSHFKQLTPFQYTNVIDYGEGYFIVERDGKKVFLNQKGKEKFGLFDQVSPFRYGFAMVSREGRYGIINHRGRFILPMEYENSMNHSSQYQFYEGLALIEKNRRFGFVNMKGEVVIEPVYQSAHHCSEGLIPVKTQNVWGYIDRNGQEFIEPFFDEASSFEWGRAEVVYNGVTFKINTEGTCVKNCATFPKVKVWLR